MSKRLRAAALTTLLLALASCSAPQEAASFDYASASEPEREAWLTEQAAATAKGFSHGLNRGGALSLFEVPAPEVDVRRQEVTFTARSESSLRTVKITGNAAKDLKATICGNYARSPFYKAGVRNTFKLLENNGQQGFRFTASPQVCDRMVAAG